MNTHLLNKSNELRDSARRLLAEADELLAKSKTTDDLIERTVLLRQGAVKYREASALMVESHKLTMEYCKLQQVEIAEQKKNYLTEKTK